MVLLWVFLTSAKKEEWGKHCKGYTRAITTICQEQSAVDIQFAASPWLWFLCSPGSAPEMERNRGVQGQDLIHSSGGISEETDGLIVDLNFFFIV